MKSGALEESGKASQKAAAALQVKAQNVSGGGQAGATMKGHATRRATEPILWEMGIGHG